MPQTEEKRETPVNLIFEGFMGAGKTTVGRAAAGILKLPFYDTDDEVRRAAGRSIHDMLEAGEIELVRSWERVVCRELGALSGAVIATGGGVFLQEANALALRRQGFVVCLERPFDEVYPVISADPVRVLACGRSYAELKTLLEGRLPLYYRSADMIVQNTDAGIAAETVVRAFLNTQ